MQRLKGKTKDDGPVPSAAVNLLDTMSTLLQDEHACSLELNALEADEDETQSVKIRSVRVDSSELERGRQKELSALREVGVATTVKRNTAAGHRVIQTRWIDKEHDGNVKSESYHTR